VCIERKADWDEVAQNFTQDRERLRREFLRMSLFSHTLFIVGQTREAAMAPGGIRSQIAPRVLFANIDSWSIRHRVPVRDVPDRACMADEIVNTLRRYMEEEHWGKPRPQSDPLRQAALITTDQWAETMIRLRSLESALHDLLHPPPPIEEEDS
jgi:hypothetical protein